MAQAASTMQQIILLILFVLPGISYQFLRERVRGPVPGERDLGERMLRAISASVALDAAYLVVAGPQLVALARPVGHVWFANAIVHPRQAAAVALALFVVIPAAAAYGVGRVQRRYAAARYRSVPTAWDSVFRVRSACFVRARLKGGAWVGGWFGTRSHASAYPHTPDLFLEAAYEMRDDGSFGPRVQGTSGLYVCLDDIEVLEFVEATPARAEREETTNG